MGSKREVLLLHYFIYVLRYIVSEESVEAMKTRVREDCYNVLSSYFGTT
jgi:hypothetical protein